MNISELLAAIGDDNVQWQNLDQCADSLNMNGNTTRITFGTEQRLTLSGTERLGLIIWLDRDAVKAAIATEKRIAALATPAGAPAISSRDLMIAGGVDPAGPFEVGPFPAEMRQRPDTTPAGVEGMREALADELTKLKSTADRAIAEGFGADHKLIILGNYGGLALEAIPRIVAALSTSPDTTGDGQDIAARAAYDALDLADRLIERGYGIDVPQEWHEAFKAVADARAALSRQSTPLKDDGRA